MAVKSINEIIPRLQQTNTGVTATPAVYIDDMFDPILNQDVRRYLASKYGDNPLINTPLGYIEGITNAWGNKQGQGVLGPAMGVLGYFGRSLDKADDFLLGTLIEASDPTGYDNPLEQIFLKDRSYEGKELIKNLINQTRIDPNAMVTDEDLKGFLPTVGGLAVDLATDPGILGGALSKIGSKSTKPVLQNLGKVGETLSQYDDLAGTLAWNAVAPGSTALARKFLPKLGDLIGWRKANDLVDRPIDPNIAADPLETYVKNATEEIKSNYKPVDLFKPGVPEVVDEVAKVEAKLPVTETVKTPVKRKAKRAKKASKAVLLEETVPQVATEEGVFQVTREDAFKELSNMVDDDLKQVVDTVNKDSIKIKDPATGKVRDRLPPPAKAAESTGPKVYQVDELTRAYDNVFDEYGKVKEQFKSLDRDDLNKFKEIYEEGGLIEYVNTLPGSAEVAESMKLGQETSYFLDDFMRKVLPEYNQALSSGAFTIKELERAIDTYTKNPNKFKGVLSNEDLFKLIDYKDDPTSFTPADVEGIKEIWGRLVSSVLPEYQKTTTGMSKRFVVRPSQYTTYKYYAPVKKYTDDKMFRIRELIEQRAGRNLTKKEIKEQFFELFGIKDAEYLYQVSKLSGNDAMIRSVKIARQKEISLLYSINDLVDNMFGDVKAIVKGAGSFENTFQAYKNNIDGILKQLGSKDMTSFLQRAEILSDDAGKLILRELADFVESTKYLRKSVENSINSAMTLGDDVILGAYKLGTPSVIEEYLEGIPFSGTLNAYKMSRGAEQVLSDEAFKASIGALDEAAIQEVSKLFPGYEITDTFTKKKYRTYLKTNQATGLQFNKVTRKTKEIKIVQNVTDSLTAPGLPTPDPIKVVQETLKETPVQAVKSEILAKAAAEEYKGQIPEGVEPAKFAETVSPFEDKRDSLFKRINNAVVSDTNVKLKNKIATEDNPVLREAKAKIESVKDVAVQKQFIKELDEAQPYVTTKGTFLTDLVASRGFKLTVAPTQEAYVALRTKLQSIADFVNKKAGKDILILNKDNSRRIVGIQLNTKVPRFQDEFAKIAKLEMAGKLGLDDEIVWWSKQQPSAAVVRTGDAKILEDAYNLATQEAQRHMIRLGHKEALDLKLKEGTSYLHHTAVSNDNYRNALLDTFDIADLDEMGKYSQAINNYLNVNKKFRSVFLSRSFEGPMSLYQDKALGKMFIDDDLSKIVTGSMTDGVLDNQNYQLFVNLFDNDNLKVRTMFKGPKELREALMATGVNNKIGGNLSQMDLVVPVYKDGTLQSIKRFDKFSEKGLQDALNNPDTLLIPNVLYAPLDRILKKDVILSNKAYQALNKYFTLPFKFGVLLNPAFPIGNVSDAFFKSVTQNQIKFGKSFMQASADFTGAMGDVIRLNNNAYDIIEKYATQFARPNELITPELLVKRMDVRERFFKYLDTFNNEAISSDKEIIKFWLILNNIQDTTVTGNFSKNLIKKFNEGLKRNAEVGQEISKGLDIDVADIISKYTVQTNIADRVLYGSDKTWGLFLNNPVSRSIMGTSKGIENLMRSAHILSNLKYNGSIKYINENIPSLAGKLDTLSEELNIKLLNALGTMNAAHFNYDDVTDIMSKLSMAIPFPTFFTKNLANWLNVAVDNPQILDNILSVHENLWDDKSEAVKSDEFVAEAKGRGAIPALGSLYKPTPYASAFGAFDLLNNPKSSIGYRLNPMTRLLTQAVMPKEDVKYRPYTTDVFTKNVKRGDPNFSYLRYALQSANPFERAIQSGLRLPTKIEQGKVQPADVLPSVFQPYFEKNKKRKK